jgi:RNA polymerase sigma-70 factor, ECF subfamily
MNEQEQIYTEILVVRSQLGEEKAFELLVQLWQKPLLVFALRYLDQETDALDVVQETWISVIKGLKKLQNPSLFVSWLFRIMTNKCIDRLQKKKTQMRQIEQVNVKHELLGNVSEKDSLMEAIKTLSEEQRVLIMLRFGQALQVGQIAAMLNIPEGTVKSRLHRALARLREILGDTI